MAIQIAAYKAQQAHSLVMTILEKASGGDEMRPVTINATSLSPFMYQGKRVVTFAMIDEVHQRLTGAARKSFNAHRQYFTEGKYFDRLTGQDLELFKLCAPIKRTHKYSPISDKAREVTLITESGYLLTVKPFNDSLSWQVQNQLIDAYSRLSEFPELQHINCWRKLNLMST